MCIYRHVFVVDAGCNPVGWISILSFEWRPCLPVGSGSIVWNEYRHVGRTNALHGFVWKKRIYIRVGQHLVKPCSHR
jgi:hypothetical protein